MKTAQKVVSRKKIHYRIKKKVKGTAARPRMSIFRSNRDIYVQLIDDVKGVTLASASSRETSVTKTINKTEQAMQVGKIIAERAKNEGIETVVFDRGGYLYHGRVKALADGAREGGLKL